MFALVPTEVWAVIGGIGAALVAVPTAWFKGRREGAAAERGKQNERELDALDRRKEIHEDVDRGGASGARDWLRKHRR